MSDDDEPTYYYDPMEQPFSRAEIEARAHQLEYGCNTYFNSKGEWGCRAGDNCPQKRQERKT